MSIKSLLFFFLLNLFFSCSRQNTSQSGDRSFTSQESVLSTGNSVSQIADSILTIYQDKKNNYWLGSNGKGVFRYDGKTIINYTAQDGLWDNRIWKIEEDKSGNVYFTTMGGINKFNGQSITKLISVRSNLPNDGWRLDPGDLWFQAPADSGVVYRYDGNILYRLELPKNEEGENLIKKFPRSKYPLRLFNPYDVYSIFKDSKGRIWFGTVPLGVCLYDGKTFTWIDNIELGLNEIAIGVRSTVEDKDGKFWFSNTKHRYDIYSSNTTGKINVKNDKGINQSKEISEAGYTYFMSGLVDNKGDLWTATFSNGVWRYDGSEVFYYPVKNGNTDVTLFSIYKDRKGELWLGTHTDGAYKFNGKTFEKFKF